MSHDSARFAKPNRLLSTLICLAVATTMSSIAYASARLNKTEILPYANPGWLSAISPDGARVAILKTTGSEGTQGEGRVKNELKIHSVASSSIDASLLLPEIEPHPFKDTNLVSNFAYQNSRVHYCDRGRYILAYGGSGTFFIVDTVSYKLKSTFLFRLDNYGLGVKPERGHIMVELAAACSANGDIATFELFSGPYGNGTTEIFDLDTGRQLGSIAEDISPGRLMGIDVSPSGASAEIAIERVKGDPLPGKDDDLVILDLVSHTVSRRILTGIDLSDAAFVGESSVAVASGGEKVSGAKPYILLFDIHTGAQTRRFADPENGAAGVVSASADGRFLLAYTGRDNFCEHCLIAEHRGYLRIEDARFTVWDVSTGKAVARSPKIPIDKGGILAFVIYERPSMEISQSGNAVLVSQPGENEPTDVYSLK
jgi:hypothetical protein